MPLPVLLSGLALAILIGLTLLVSGQPLFTDDAWFHLALGEVYASEGPWLDRDPLLAVSPGPPTPAAWLFDVLLHVVQAATGYTGLRVLHVCTVGAIIVVVWRAFRRAAEDRLYAHVATAAFIVLAAYRLIQLRPHLFTMLAVPIVCGFALLRDRPLTRREITGLAVLFAVWANMHAAFLLGPILLGAGAAGLFLTAIGRHGPTRSADLARARSLAVATIVGGLATLLNPGGVRPHLAFFVAGEDTPSLGRVADEWSRVDLLAWPPVDLPPSWLSWCLVWVLLLSTVALVVKTGLEVRRRMSGDETTDSACDAALVALAIVGCALPFVAVRFLWLGFLPLLALGDALRRSGWFLERSGWSGRWVAALVVVASVPGFVTAGPWPMISSALPTSWAGYRLPYYPGKYHAALVWTMQDARLEGTLFTVYNIAGFAGRQLAPRVKNLVNGSLNVPPDVIEANLPLRRRRGERPGERFVDLLDRHEIDLYMGIRLPRFSRTDRPWFHTTAHLEQTEGWVPIFRNLNGALYLRSNERNRENLARVAGYYAARSIPFDPATGFSVERVIEAAPRWAIAHGIVPRDFEALRAATVGSESQRRSFARHRLASIYAALGAYERALDIDLPDLSKAPDRVLARRRVVWSLLRLGRFDEAADQAELLLASAQPQDGASHIIAEAALRAASMTDDEERSSLVRTLSLLTDAEVPMVMRGVQGPSPRSGI